MANECIPFYEDGDEVTCVCEVAVVGKRFVAISGDRTSGPGLATTSEGGNYTISPATAGGRIFGIAQRDAAIGELVTVLRTPNQIYPVKAGAAITAFSEVEVGTDGQAIPHASGIAVGFATTGAGSGLDAEISLYAAAAGASAFDPTALAAEDTTLQAEITALTARVTALETP